MVGYVKCNERSKNRRTLLGLLLVTFSSLLGGFHGNSCDHCRGPALHCLHRAPEMSLLPLASPLPSAPPTPPSPWYRQVSESWEEEGTHLHPWPPRGRSHSPRAAPPTGPFWLSWYPRRRKPLPEGRMPSDPDSALGRNSVKLNQSKTKSSCAAVAAGTSNDLLV